MVVAIDGPAGTGKSSVCSCVAARTGLFYLNSGRFYRAVTYLSLHGRVSMSDDEALAAVAAALKIEVVKGHYVINGQEMEQELHTPEIDAHVARVSTVAAVRYEVNKRLKCIAGTRDVIVEGRDMSTVVFPDAELKIYLDADLAVRARRRHRQLGAEGDFELVLDSMRQRDGVDTTKEVGRLQRPHDALYIDSTHLTLEEVCEKVAGAIHQKTDQWQE